MKSGVKAIYRKPLTGGEIQGSADQVLKQLRGQFLRRLRVQLQQTAFSREAKKALAKAMKVEVKKNSVVLTVNHPAWRPLIEGQKREQMVWLKRAKAPIPIITETGKLIFRSATAKSMKDGRWIHPGRKPSNLVEKARLEAREWAKKKVGALLKREIARSMQGK